MPSLPRHASTLAALLLCAAGLPSIAAAQDETQQPAQEPAEPPQQTGEGGGPQLPWTVGEDMQQRWTLTDPALRTLMDGLIGSFQTGDSPATPGGVHFHSCAIDVEGLDNAVFFEIHRADDVANSFQFGVLHAYNLDRGPDGGEGGPRLRFFEFANKDQGPALSGLWLAPYALPTLALDDLRPVMDIALDPADWSGATQHPYPTVRDGAVELTSDFALTDDGFTLADRGYDTSGTLVWGVEEGHMLPFTRFEPEASVHTTEGGAIVLDLIDPDDAERLASGGDIAVHYTGYLLTGKKFDSSRTPERGPFRVQIPGQLIQGWNEGLIGIAVGGRRRLIIPPHLGYGPRAVGGGLIPANSTLIFDVEAMWLKNPPVGWPSPPTERPADEQKQDQVGGNSGG